MRRGNRSAADAGAGRHRARCRAPRRTRVAPGSRRRSRGRCGAGGSRCARRRGTPCPARRSKSSASPNMPSVCSIGVARPVRRVPAAWKRRSSPSRPAGRARSRTRRDRAGRSADRRDRRVARAARPPAPTPRGRPAHRAGAARSRAWRDGDPRRRRPRAPARRASRTDSMIRRQVPQEDRLDDDGLEAATLGLERAEDRAIHRGGLSARIRDVGGRLAVQEDLPRCGPSDATQRDRAAVRESSRPGRRPVGSDPRPGSRCG